MKLPIETAESEGPNLTPVIDVVFLLLIFFLVATQYAQEELEVNINLPEVAEAQPLTMTQKLVVNIMPDGKYKVATQEFTGAELAALISEAKKNNPQQSALIRGDGDSDLKYAVRVMGMCNKVDMEYQIAALPEN